MKKLLLPGLFSIFAFCGQANAQVYVEGKNINDMPSVKLCEVLLFEDMVVSSNIKVSLDYGQARKEFKDQITDQKGKEIKFPSAVAALNHMENNGWMFVQSIITLKDRGAIYRYYFRRKEGGITPTQDTNRP